eukprot:9010112-Pyramimonas_sp.AAC.1
MAAPCDWSLSLSLQHSTSAVTVRPTSPFSPSFTIVVLFASSFPDFAQEERGRCRDYITWLMQQRTGKACLLTLCGSW